MRVLNPLASYRCYRRQGRPYVELQGPIKGRGLQVKEVPLHPGLLRILEGLFRNRRPSIPARWSRILEAGAVLVRPREVPGEPTLHGRLPTGRKRRFNGVPNPTLEVRHDATVSIRDPATGVSATYSMRGPHRRAIRDLLTAESVAGPFDAALSAAHMIVPRTFIGRRTEQGRRRCREARRRLRRNGYAPIHDLLHPFQVDAFRKHARRLVREGHLRSVGTQGQTRDGAHDPPAFRRLHRELAGLVGKVAGELVVPTYCYLVSYARGASLPKHCDRIHCLWTVTLAIDYEPDCARPAAYPLHLEVAPGRTAAVRLGLGDGVLYDGCRIPHFRNPLKQGRRATFVLLHYVPVDLRGAKADPQI